MIHSIAACFARFPIGALMMTLVGWVGTAHADVFAAISGEHRVAFTCEGPVVVDTSCSIEIGQGSSREIMPVRFANQPTRYAHLLKLGIEKAIESNRRAFRLDQSDISLLRGLALDKCHPASEHSGDLLQLCIPIGSSSTVVLFKRDVCDRCDFEPIILRKQAAPRPIAAAPASGVDCLASCPTRPLGIMMSGMGSMYVSPARVPPTFSGCQIAWDEQKKMRVRIRFDNGKIQRFEAFDTGVSPIALACFLENGKLSASSSRECAEMAIDQFNTGLPATPVEDTQMEWPAGQCFPRLLRK
jgi:hypothetical protein